MGTQLPGGASQGPTLCPCPALAPPPPPPAPKTADCPEAGLRQHQVEQTLSVWAFLFHQVNSVSSTGGPG